MNRKQRRAQQSSSSSSTTSTTKPIENADQIPLSVPDRDNRQSHGKKAKTLYEIAAEKQAELLPQVDRLNASRTTAATPLDPSNLVSVKVGPDGTIVHDDDTNRPFRVEELSNDANTITNTNGGSDEANDTSEQLPPVIDTLMLVLSLGAIHFTLEFLTVHQYAEEVHFGSIARHTLFVAMPTLFLMVHLFHGHLFAVPFLAQQSKYLLQQVFFVGVANAAGCYLIQLTNDRGYYAVMKNAPSIGTVWVWSVIELGLAGALAGVVGPGLYAWWYGYGVF